MAVLDGLHGVKLGTGVIDEVRRRVQQDRIGRPGHKEDPLYQPVSFLRSALIHGPPKWDPREPGELRTCEAIARKKE